MQAPAPVIPEFASPPSSSAPPANHPGPDRPFADHLKKAHTQRAKKEKESDSARAAHPADDRPAPAQETASKKETSRADRTGEAAEPVAEKEPRAKASAEPLTQQQASATSPPTILREDPAPHPPALATLLASGVLQPEMEDNQLSGQPPTGTNDQEIDMSPLPPLLDTLTAVINQEAGETGSAAIAPSQESPGVPAPEEGQATLPIHGEAHGEITIEHWSAKFSLDFTVTSEVPGGQIESDAQQGQVLATTAPEIGDMMAETRPASSGNVVALTGQRQDAATSFMQSHLPTGVIETLGQEDHTQFTGENSRDEQASLYARQEGVQTGHGAANGETPLIFSLDQSGALAPHTSSSLAGPTAPSLHLSNGVEIPASHIINQVAGHFSGQRHLESGTVNLRLHPAELGELRMEIKVEQDNIRAHIVAQNPQVQELLEHHLPRLRQALNQQGLNLEQMQVTLATDDRASQFSHERDRREPFHQPAPQRPARPILGITEETQEEQSRPGNLRIVA